MLLLAEFHQPLRRLSFQMEDIQSGIHAVRYIDCRSGIGISGFFPFCFQCTVSVNAVVNRLRRLINQLLEISLVPLFCFAAHLISQVFFQLLHIGRHLLWCRNTLIFLTAVKLNHIS